MTVIIDDIVTRVREVLELRGEVTTQKAVGDSQTLVWPLLDTPIIEGSLVVSVDSDDGNGAVVISETTGGVANWEIDCYTGYFTWLDTALTDTQTIYWTYRTQRWSDEEIIETINEGIDYLYPDFYRPRYTTTYIDLDPNTSEYAAPADADIINEIYIDDVWNLGYWVQWRRWVTYEGYDETAAAPAMMIRFTDTVPYGSARLHYMARPGHFTAYPAAPYVYEDPEPPEGPNLLSGPETLEDTVGYPDRAKKALILYAKWQLLSQMLAHRVRDDRAHNTESENSVSELAINRTVQMAKLEFDLHLGRLAQQPVVGRLVD
jgi:hypothetical protein